jgi:hypothetical protein
MSDVTHIRSAIGPGDLHAAAQLLPRVSDELRQQAAQRLDQEWFEETVRQRPWSRH